MNSLPFLSYRVIVLFLLSSITLSLSSQTNGEDVITLKDGTVYRGVVIEQKPGKHIKVLQLPSLDTVLIELKTIDLLSKDLVIPNEVEPDSASVQKVDLQDIKMFNVNKHHVSINYLLGGGDFAVTGLGLSLMRNVSSTLQAGLDVNYIADVGNSSSYKNSLPICGKVSFELREHDTGRTAILTNLAVGYNILLSDSFTFRNTGEEAYYSNGLYVNPSIGYRLNLFQEAGIQLNVGYQMITSKGYSQESGQLLNNKTWSNFLFTGSLFF